MVLSSVHLEQNIRKTYKRQNMRYTSFLIKNFKGIKELELKLENLPNTKVTTLVGLNESGKTSILQAIDLFHNGFDESKLHMLIPKKEKYSFSESISVEARLSLEPKDEKHLKDFCKKFEYKSIQPIKEIIVSREYNFVNSRYVAKDTDRDWNIDMRGLKKNHSKQKNFSDEEWSEVVREIEESLMPEILYYPDFLFDFPERIYLEKHNSESEEQEVYRSVLSDVLKSIGVDLSIDEHIVKRIKSAEIGDKEALRAMLLMMGAKITKVVFEAWEKLFSSSGKEIIIAEGLDPSTNISYLELRLKENNEPFQIAERSLGFKWFFTFLLFTEFRKNRVVNESEILFLLDEPASNLHSTAQKKLLATFEKLVDKSKLIYTTHSHHLINPSWLSGAYIVRNKAINYSNEFEFNSKKSDIEATPYRQFVTQFPEQRDYFQPILDSLDYQPGLLEKVPSIIVTEGKFDFFAFKYFNEVILGNLFENLRFYPGAGVDKNDPVIRLYLSWGRSFQILLDGDEAGAKAKERYIKEIGGEISKNIVTLRDVDSTMSFDLEQMFTEAERLAITKLFRPDAIQFNKGQFNTALQELYLSKKLFEFSVETVDRFKTVLSYLYGNQK